MFFKQYLDKLQKFYDRNSNDLLVVYGNRRTGLFDLISTFTSDKESFYYKAHDVCASLQEKFFIKELNNQTKGAGYIKNDYEKILLTYLENSSHNKKVIVFDDFTYLLNVNPTYLNLILNLISEKCNQGSVMFIFMSNDEKWVEQDMVKILGKTVYEFSEIIHVLPLSYSEIIEQENAYPQNEIFSLYTCIGGSYSLWKNINLENDFKSIICKYILDENSTIYQEGLNIIPDSIRQKTVYQTILYNLASGNNKLNDLYNSTGISRAKLSVYINHLVEHNIVYKDECISYGDSSNISKGLYKIKDPFVHFWYYYVFPNMSLFKIASGERFYRKIIAQSIGNYINVYYPEYCIYKLLNGDFEKDITIKGIDKYNDKNEIIDFIITCENDEIIVCACDIKSPHLSYKDYENVLAITNNAKIKYDKIALFSAGGFDQKLYMSSKIDEHLLLFDGKDRFTSKFT